MSSNRDQLQALIAEIDGILRKMNSRLPWVSLGDTRRVLERVRLYLDSQLASEGSPGVSLTAWEQYPIAPDTRASAPQEDREAAGIQAVFQGLIQDLAGLRSNLMQPLQEEIATLSQERHSLMEEVRQLEQKKRHYSTVAGQQADQQQAISEFLQALLGPLQEHLSQEVSQAIGQIETHLLTDETPSRLGGNALESKFRREPVNPLTEENSELLSPQARLEQLQRLEGESDRLLMSLDSTLRVVFEALDRNVNSYNDSLVQGLEKMHRLGQQGELMFSVLVNHLAQLLGQETSSYLQSSLQLLYSTPSALDGTPESNPEPPNPALQRDRLEKPPIPPKLPPNSRIPSLQEEPQTSPKTPRISAQGSKAQISPEQSQELLKFPFAGAELTPLTEGTEAEITAEAKPLPISKTRQEMSQDNFEFAAQLAQSSQKDEDLSSVSVQEPNRVSPSNLNPDDLLPELGFEGWVTPDDQLPEEWDLSAAFDLEENLPPASELLPPSNPNNQDLFPLSAEPNSQETGETSPYGEEDLFADLASLQDAPGMGGEYSEEYMDEFLFGDRLESLLTDSESETDSPPLIETTESPKKPEPPGSKNEETTDDLFADFETVSPSSVEFLNWEPETLDASTPPPLIEDSLPQLGDEAISSNLNLEGDWDETAYLTASPQENLLAEEDLEEELDNLWLSNTGIKRLDEDLSKLEAIQKIAEPQGTKVQESGWQGTELSAEQWLAEFTAESPSSERVNWEDVEETLPGRESRDSPLEPDAEEFLPETAESDPVAIALNSDFFNEQESSSVTEKEILLSESKPINSGKTESPAKAVSPTLKQEPEPEATRRANSVLPTLDDIFAELMATNPPPVVKITAEEGVNHETVEDFFANFMDDENPATAPADPEPEATQPEVPLPPDDDLSHPTLDNFFESWDDGPTR